MTTHELLVRAIGAKRIMATASEDVKNQALHCMADALLSHTEEILAANAEDMTAAKDIISDIMLDTQTILHILEYFHRYLRWRS